MLYSNMKKLISNQNTKYTNGDIDVESYNSWKDATMNKLDIFLALDRITSTQYQELANMFLAI